LINACGLDEGLRSVGRLRNRLNPPEKRNGTLALDAGAVLKAVSNANAPCPSG